MAHQNDLFFCWSKALSGLHLERETSSHRSIMPFAQLALSNSELNAWNQSKFKPYSIAWSFVFFPYTFCFAITGCFITCSSCILALIHWPVCISLVFQRKRSIHLTGNFRITPGNICSGNLFNSAVLCLVRSMCTSQFDGSKS